MDPQAVEILDQIEQDLINLLEVAPNDAILMVDTLLWEFKNGKQAA